MRSHKQILKYSLAASTLIAIIFLIFFFIKQSKILPLKYINYSGDQLYKIAIKYKDSGYHYDYIEPEYYEKAAFFYEKSINKGIHKREAYWDLFWIYYDLRKYKKAENTLNKGLRNYPTDIWFLFYRADVRSQLKEYKNALNDYDQVIKTKEYGFKYYYQAVYERGCMKYILGDFANSKTDYDTAQKYTNYKLRTYEDYSNVK